MEQTLIIICLIKLFVNYGGLNPCSNGIDFDQIINLKINYYEKSLNPCSNGIDFDRY